MSVPACYATLYLSLSKKARELGYSLALHGSLVRDLDLIAVPWTDAAVTAEELVRVMVEMSGGFLIHREDADPFDFTKRNPQPKPHGRLAWSIHLGGGPYIDLSVMPRNATPALTRDRLIEVLDKNFQEAGIDITTRRYNQIIMEMGFCLE